MIYYNLFFMSEYFWCSGKSWFYFVLVSVTQLERDEEAVGLELDNDLRNVVGNLNISFEDDDQDEPNLDKKQVIFVIIFILFFCLIAF